MWERHKDACWKGKRKYQEKNIDEANNLLLESKSSSEEHEYEDDEEDIFTEEDSVANDCSSDFEEWMEWNKKRTRLKEIKSYSD